MVFDVCSIRVFHNFSLDPYYEPLPWSMIISNNDKNHSMDVNMTVQYTHESTSSA